MEASDLNMGRLRARVRFVKGTFGLDVGGPHEIESISARYLSSRVQLRTFYEPNGEKFGTRKKCPAGVFYRRRPVTDSPYRRDRANVRWRTADVK